MEQINAYEFYRLGSLLRDCREAARSGLPVREWGVSLRRAREELEVLNRGTASFRFKESSEAASALVVLLTEVYDEYIEGLYSDERQDDALDEHVRGDFEVTLETFEQALSLELGRAPIFFVTDKGIYDTRRLISSAADVYNKWDFTLPSDTIDDTNQAGRCLAFNLPTAAGFHIARATESVIKQYMAHHGVTPNERNWHDYIKVLKGKAPQELRSALQQLKDLHRNPLMHPEITLDEGEAERLFMMCVSVMGGMVDDMRRKPQRSTAANA